MTTPTNRVAIVTGASGGIGAAVAERLAKDGFTVVVNYAGNSASAAAVVARIEAAGGRAVAAQADISDVAAVARMFDSAETAFGGVDVLINNAGIMNLATIADSSDALFDHHIAPLFPERRAYTASYALSPVEADLYQAVTTYVREEMNRADRSGDDKRRSNVGFALQILQRRLASSPAAIHRSLERRRKRLEERLREEKLMRQTGAAPLSHAPVLPAYDPDDIDEVPGNEAEESTSMKGSTPCP
jgi:hypothetical protein